MGEPSPKVLVCPMTLEAFVARNRRKNAATWERVRVSSKPLSVDLVDRARRSAFVLLSWRCTMASKLIWGILLGVIVGAAFGYIGGNTPIGIAICIAAGAIAAGIWHSLSTRNSER